MRVLLVEDEVRLAQAIARGLIAEGFTVDIEHDGVDGFWRAREGRYDTVVLDLLLPRLNGYLITERLRGENVWTPILMLTAKDGEHDEADGLDAGADDYLRKPFSFVVLVARLCPGPTRPPLEAHHAGTRCGDVGSGQRRGHGRRARRST